MEARTAQGASVSFAEVSRPSMTTSLSCRIVAASIWGMVLFGLGLRVAELVTGLAGAAVVVVAAALAVAITVRSVARTLERVDHEEGVKTAWSRAKKA